MERLFIDFTELPFCHITNDRWILVMVDHMSSYVWMECFPSKNTVPVAIAIMKIISEYGDVELLCSDNGREFVSGVIEAS